MSVQVNFDLSNKTLLQRSGLVANFKGATEYIGLSVSDYLSIELPLRTIFFSDSETLRSVEDATALALASDHLNRSTMVGSASKGIALYLSGTSDAVLTRAARALGATYSPLGFADIVAMSGLLAVYDFVQGADPDVLYDLSGNARHGALGGTAKPTWLSARGTLHFREDKSVVIIPSTAMVSGDAAMTVVSSQMLSQRNEYAFNHIWGYRKSDSGRICPSAMIKAAATVTPELRTGGDDLTMTGTVDLNQSVIQWSYNPTGTVLSGVINGDYTAEETKTLGAVLAADNGAGAAIGAYGSSNANAFTGPIYGWASFNRVLTDDEIYNVAKILTPPKTNDLIVFDGNSLTYGYPLTGIDSYPHKLIHAMTTRPEWVNFSLAGQTTTEMAADFDAQVAPMFSTSRSSQILVAWEIGNDIVVGGVDPTVAHTNFKNYCLHARSSLPPNTKIVVINLTPRTTAGFNEARATVNSLMAAQWATYADALVDVAANEFIGPDGAEDNTTYYNADKIHLTAAGYQIVADLVAATLAAL